MWSLRGGVGDGSKEEEKAGLRFGGMRFVFNTTIQANKVGLFVWRSNCKFESWDPIAVGSPLYLRFRRKKQNKPKRRGIIAGREAEVSITAAAV